MTTTAALQPCPNFIGGEWSTPKTKTTTKVYNPSTGEVIAETPMCGPDVVDQAVAAAEKAFPDWAATPPIERARILFRFKMLLEDNFEELAESVTREHGKTLVEARGDVRRGIEIVEYACGMPSLLMGETLENIARGIDCETILQPLGVCVGITPFNFPRMVPLWMFPLALACGNTFVLKPSEKVPLTAHSIDRSCSKKPGCPKACSTSCTADASAWTRCSRIRRCKAISFVGSTPVAQVHLRNRHAARQTRAGQRRREELHRRHAGCRRGQRPSSGVVDAAFGCAGERCMAGSTADHRRRRGGTVLPDAGRSDAKRIKVGPTDRDAQPDMGPSSPPAASRPRAQTCRSRRERKARRFSPMAAA